MIGQLRTDLTRGYQYIRSIHNCGYSSSKILAVGPISQEDQNLFDLQTGKALHDFLIVLSKEGSLLRDLKIVKMRDPSIVPPDQKHFAILAVFWNCLQKAPRNFSFEERCYRLMATGQVDHFLNEKKEMTSIEPRDLTRNFDEINRLGGVAAHLWQLCSRYRATEIQILSRLWQLRRITYHQSLSLTDKELSQYIGYPSFAAVPIKGQQIFLDAARHSPRQWRSDLQAILWGSETRQSDRLIETSQTVLSADLMSFLRDLKSQLLPIESDNEENELKAEQRQALYTWSQLLLKILKDPRDLESFSSKDFRAIQKRKDPLVKQTNVISFLFSYCKEHLIPFLNGTSREKKAEPAAFRLLVKAFEKNPRLMDQIADAKRLYNLDVEVLYRLYQLAGSLPEEIRIQVVSRHCFNQWIQLYEGS